MAQPPAYERQADFSAFAAANPATPHSGVNLDAEFNRIKATSDAVRTNLALIQRDDGQIASQAVGIDQLSPEIDFGLRTVADWVTATAYRLRDGVYESSKLYRCVVAHTSGTFATDLTAEYWVEVVDLDGGAADAAAAAEASATAAASSAGTASSSSATAVAAASAASDSADAAAASAVEAAAATGGLRVSSNDTTPADLEAKLLPGPGISLTTQNGGGNETRTISYSGHGENIRAALGL